MKILVADPIGQEGIDILRNCAEVDVKTGLKPEELISIIGEYEGLVVRSQTQVTARVIAAGSRLQVIARAGVGVDNIDLDTARVRGIIVTNTPGVLTEDTADMTMALILAAPRRMGEGERLLRAGEWKGWAPTQLMGRRVSGKRLGIVGMGRIGTAVARRAKAFGLQIHYHNRKPVRPAVAEELEATYWESLDQMLARMDIVSINCPHTPATYHLLSARRIKLMKPDTYLVNTARGEVIDEAALIRALEAGEIAGAGLDVFENEPNLNPRLKALRNVVVLPHMSSATLEGRIDMGEKVIINIKTFADGHKPPDRVIPAML